MFRVINEDLSTNETLDIIAECETIEKAKEIEVENYIFNTSVEQFVNGEWKTVLINGMTEQESKEFSQFVFQNF